MKVLFNTTDGVIFYAVTDARWFYFVHSTNTPLTEFEIDEVGANASICVDLIRTLNRFDVAGEPKYFMFDNAGNWELHEKPGWVEAIIDV